MFISNQTSSVSWSSAQQVSHSNSGRPNLGAPTPIAPYGVFHSGEQAVLSDNAVVLQAQGQLGRDWSRMLGSPNGIVTGYPGQGPEYSPNTPPVPMPTLPDPGTPTNWLPRIPEPGPYTNWPTPLDPGTNMPTLPDPGRPTNRLPRVSGPGTRPGGPFTNWPGIEGPGRPAGPFTNWPEERLVRR